MVAARDAAFSTTSIASDGRPNPRAPPTWVFPEKARLLSPVCRNALLSRARDQGSPESSGESGASSGSAGRHRLRGRCSSSHCHENLLGGRTWELKLLVTRA